jgi:phenylpropionate dioxygenase-like ring-hydroxylating dioxygenase large terminal subunit
MTITPTIDPAAPLPDIGRERVSGQRFYSPQVMQQEWPLLWRRVWNMGPRLEELRNPGDYVVHSLGRESFLFCRDKQGVLRGFYNVCQHRGNRLVAERSCGDAAFFRCAFHGWSWNLDGSIKGIPERKDFPQILDGSMDDDLGLTPVRIDEWGGWLWFHLDDNAAPLQDFLGVIPEHLAPWRLEDMQLYEYKTFLWDCNWKTAVDAFNESYHFRTLHPQMVYWANDRAKLELLGEHSRMINEYGTTSTPYRSATEVFPELKMWMSHYGMDPDTYEGAPADVRLAKQAFSRQVQDSVPHLPYADLTDEQLSDVYHYFIFPGFAMNVFAEGINGFRYRPHETDPNKMYYDLIMLVHLPPDHGLPPCEHKFYDQPVTYADIADNPVGSLVTDVLQQDADNVASVQAGLQSEGFRGAVLGDQEIRLRHFHNTWDAYMAGPEEQK